MQSGMINNVKVTNTNVTDNNHEAVKSVIPSQGAAGDKGFVGTIPVIEETGCHCMIILKYNMKEKNKGKDKFIGKLRAPYERVFSKQEKRVRYKGIEKNQVAEYIYTIGFNLRRLLVLGATTTRV